MDNEDAVEQRLIDHLYLKPNMMLDYHRRKYFKAISKEENLKSEPYQLIQIQDFFKHNKIKIVKLNHCLISEGATQFDGYMQLSEQGD